MAAVANGNQATAQLNLRIRLAWPETITIGAGLFFLAIILLFWALLADGVGSTHDARLNLSVFDLLLECEFAFVLPLWLLLRTVHFLLHGIRHWHAGRPSSIVAGSQTITDVRRNDVLANLQSE